ncbi:saccharopine dehydrogenase family protein [Candidatus Korarchaeum cryptofilum]|uniref:Saccharopine dehydrogenase family protein n=1 Tax=Candidatus Korarchaeum cryptofilum TaxID=498846 RepID=A0A429GA01_9CREN|nr:saccharopine dehydrogenase C-terminal domain-containing protein [Candidatus Korarchaeum cryptofilum]RSN70623.1 saccharopine dehydrogenase family protein [Candidatus Korarchaeum cryptofilum]
MAVFGAGSVGRAIIYDLYERVTGSNLLVVDANPSNLEAASKIASKAEFKKADLKDVDDFYRIMKDVDIAVNSLPGRFGKLSWVASIKAKTDLVDVSYSEDDPTYYHVQAGEAGVTIVPDAGVAPGLSNMMAGRAYAQLEEVKELKIYVGGIPERPIPPLGYLVTWSPEDLIEEYVRDARLIESGSLTKKPALSDLERIYIPEIGELEAFLTDGLRTMLKTLKGVEFMAEKTLRWPGHAEKIELLRTLGYFSKEPISNSEGITPAHVTARLFREKLKGDSKDLVILIVQAKGRRSPSNMEIEYRMIDRYDEATGLTALARTTAFSATGIVKLIAEGSIPGPGVLPPEVIGMDENLFALMAEWLSWRGIRIVERVTESRMIPST